MEIEVNDLEVMYQDSGAWRSYALATFGETVDQLVENASIYEIDQDGGELNSYDLGDASGEVYDSAMSWIVHEFEKECTEDGGKKRCTCKQCQDLREAKR
jgi:hypothetical protein